MKKKTYIFWQQENKKLTSLKLLQFVIIKRILRFTSLDSLKNSKFDLTKLDLLMIRQTVLYSYKPYSPSTKSSQTNSKTVENHKNHSQPRQTKRKNQEEEEEEKKVLFYQLLATHIKLATIKLRECSKNFSTAVLTSRSIDVIGIECGDSCNCKLAIDLCVGSIDS